MRVLVTRPEPGATETAGRLRALGHDPVISPVSCLRPIAASVPAEPIDAVIVSSANALRTLEPAMLERLQGLPAFVVGQATAAVARRLGLSAVAGPGTAEGLADLMARRFPPPATLLFLAGEPRKPVLERSLAQYGFRLVLCLCYRMEPAQALAPRAITALHDEAIDAVLHFSRESAVRFATLAIAATCRRGADKARHLCMSRDVAEGLAALTPSRLRISERPTEEGLISLLDEGD